MKAGNGNHFEQAYNAQAAVEVDSRLIVGERVSDAPNDKEQLVPTLRSVREEAAPVVEVLIDSGFVSEQAVLGCRRCRPATWFRSQLKIELASIHERSVGNPIFSQRLAIEFRRLDIAVCSGIKPGSDCE